MSGITAARFQRELIQLADELEDLDRRLSDLADRIRPDLLADAARELREMSEYTEQSVLERRSAITSAIERLAAEL